MNNNNPFNDLPRKVDDNNTNNNNKVLEPQIMPTQTEPQEEKKPIIEIPQEYYDKLERERREKELKEQEQIAKQEEASAIRKENNQMFTLAMFCALVVFASLFLTIKIHELLLLIIPVFIIVFSFIGAFKDKEESNFPASILIGGMISAVISFVLSMIFEEKMDLYTYFAIASAISAFLGLTIANVITKIVTKSKEIKALQTIGYFLFFALLIGGPIFIYTKYPEAFYKYVFQKQGEVHAETEDEFIVKTLKNRYGKNFTCSKEFKTHIWEGTTTEKERICKDDEKREVVVESIAFNQTENKYIIIDNYTDVLLLNSIRGDVNKSISTKVENIRSVATYLYPKENCKFYGDCVQCDEYLEHIEDGRNLEKLYKTSSDLNFEKSISNTPLNFVNNNEFKVVININIDAAANLGNEVYSRIVENILETLNEMQLKNNYGYQITINRVHESDGIPIKDYSVKGASSKEGFVNPQVVK